MMISQRAAVGFGWLVALSGAVAVLGWSTGPVMARLGEAGPTPDASVAAAAAVVGWAVLAWFALGVALSLAEVMSSGTFVARLARTLAPRGLRRSMHASMRNGLLAGALSASVLAPVPALADSGQPTSMRLVDDQPPPSWPALDRPAQPVPEPQPSRRPASTPAPASAATTYRVRPGDSLWSIAVAHLPAGASDAQVARAWPGWWNANRAVIGPDPGLIHPGQLLRPPSADR